MLRSLFSVLSIFALSATPIIASNLVAPIGIVESGGSLSVAVAPQSTLVVTLDLVTEQVAVGPYARYAQKLLGMRAPLVDKSTTTIAAADIELAATDHYVAKLGCDKPVVESSVTPLPVDAMSGSVLPAESAAERAAEEIFRIRRTRREMVAGDLGEGLFGAGLEVALARLDQEEQNYLALFMGRTTTTRESRKFEVPMDVEQNRYIVCRYSPQMGVVDSSDLSAEPILLQITPSGKKPIVSPTTADKASRSFRVADQSICELFYGPELLSSSVIPVFEFGYNIHYIVK